MWVVDTHISHLCVSVCRKATGSSMEIRALSEFVVHPLPSSQQLPHVGPSFREAAYVDSPLESIATWQGRETTAEYGTLQESALQLEVAPASPARLNSCRPIVRQVRREQVNKSLELPCRKYL